MLFLRGYKKELSARVLWLAVIFLCLSIQTGVAQTDQGANDPLNEDYLLIVDIYLGKYRLAENVFIYNPPEAALIPLQSFFDALDLPIEVDPHSGKAFGWFIDEANSFDLDINRRELFIRNQHQSIPTSELILLDDFDIYVDLSLLEQWLSLELALNSGRLRIDVHSPTPLPLEKQLEREKKRSRALVRSTTESLPAIKDHYHLLGQPVIDVTLGERFDNDESDSFYTLQASSDILGMETHLSVAKTSNGTNARKLFRLSKKPDSMTEDIIYGLDGIAMGDIFAVSDDLLFSGGEGLGVDLEFGGVRNNSNFGKKIIEGDAPSGWEVELYRNGSLVAFQVIGDDGRYRFEDVPVEFGENTFDIRLFGPQGQEKNHREHFKVGENMLSVGQFYGRLNYTDLNRNVFGKKDTGSEQKMYVQGQYGVTENLAAGLAFGRQHNIEDDALSRNYGVVNLLGAFPLLSLGLNTAMQESAGWATALNGQTRVGGVTLSMQHKVFDDFISDRSNDGTLDNESELRFSGLLPSVSVPYDIVARQQNYVDSGDNFSLTNKLGFQVYSGRLTVDTDYFNRDSSNSEWRGQSSYSQVIGRSVRVRSNLNYTISPDLELLSSSSSFIWHPAQRWRTQTGFNLDLTGKSSNQLNFSASYLFDRMALSLNANVNDAGDSMLVFSSEWSLAANNDAGGWSLHSAKRSQSGRAKVRVFLDHDGDGHYSNADQPLEGVQFSGRSDWKSSATNQQGLLFLDGLSKTLPTRLSLDESSLDDPYWKPTVTEVQVISHAGGLQVIDFPVIAVVDVEGSISILHDGIERPLAGIPISIHNDKGEVTTGLTEFDGYFVITGLPAGDYQLSLNRKALQRFGIPEQKPVNFRADPDEGVVYIDPIVLEATVPDTVPDKVNPQSMVSPKP